MEQIFKNFKAFVAEHLPFHPVNFILQPMNLDTFVMFLIQQKSHIVDIREPKKVAEVIIKKLELNPSNFQHETHDKFQRYIEYFLTKILM